MTYPVNHKCAECGWQFGDHASNGQWCPLGSRHRAVGFIRYSDHRFFKPVMPHVPKEITEAIAGMLPDTMTREEQRASYVHMMNLRIAVRTLLVENRQLKAELKELKKCKP